MDVFAAVWPNLVIGAIVLVALFYVIRAGVAAGIQLDRERQDAKKLAATTPVTHLDRDGL